ncbi:azurin [Natronospira bacteriovora]|uniref:Azurin n=1 Tax=Natronospira bacteriovora TaxID=3069753 RepID=A0ABU0W9K1_9GAMM|nr:azurin [Natronospira sp. AB-CW4]MDQ2070637.1 azurin [Natronospira sp. AB-CW4]
MSANRAIVLIAGLFLFPLGAMANDCHITVESDDQMNFDSEEIVIDQSCEEIELTLKHVGDLGVDTMGHNIVFTRAEDLESLAQDAMQASEDDYVPAGDDRVVAATNLIGGGETTTLTLDPSLFDGDERYAFFCSFPGHWGAMQGEVRLVN